MSSSLTSTYLTKPSLESSRVTSYGDLASTASLFLLDGSLDVLRITRSPRSSSVGSRSIETTFRKEETLNDTIIRAFESAQFGTVRALSVDGEPWFVAKDVCDALGLGNVGQALSRLDEDEKSSITLNDGTPGNPNKLVVNEPGLYTLVLSSRKPEAHAFKRWVTHDVLPALRRDGAYVASDGTEDDATLMARALLAAKRQMDAKDRQLREQRERIAALGDENARLLPMATYAETTLDAVGCITVTDAARQLKQQDPSIGQRRLFGLLRADGMLCKNTNQATAQAIERGYLRNVQRFYTDSEGVQRMREPYAVVTPKGLAWMVSRYCRQTAIA